jgi:hypothetical protein
MTRSRPTSKETFLGTFCKTLIRLLVVAAQSTCNFSEREHFGSFASCNVTRVLNSISKLET